jgi:hypothetical protein
MGTHNMLLRLGEATYLEVIAANPHAAKPARARWFGLDELPHGAEPRLACWVARTDSVHESVAGASEALGRIEPMSRGALEWLISIPEDGSLPLGGVAPALIQWLSGIHPAASMRETACTLVALELLHPEPGRVTALLTSLGIAEPDVQVSVLERSAPGLVAHIRTPQGLRRIGG